MFGLFRPRPPLDTSEKAWIESRLAWIAREFGVAALRNVETLRPADLPSRRSFHGTEAEVRGLLDPLCGRFGVDRYAVDLTVVPDVTIPGAGATYEKNGARTLIRVSETTAADPLPLVAALAHELGHVRLLGEGRVSDADADHEPLTDLLVAAFGVGVIAANATVDERFEHTGGWFRWEISRRGYLAARDYGYALALLAWVRGETKPDWLSDLRLDAREPCRLGLSYVLKTGDSLFRPDDAGRPAEVRPLSAVLDQLRRGTPTFRWAAVYELEVRGETSGPVLRAIADRLADQDRDVRSAAATVLGRVAPDDPVAQQELFGALGDDEPAVRLAAAAALEQATSLPAARLPEAESLLASRQPRLWDAAARLLARFGPAAEPAAERLVGPLTDALIDCRHDSVDALVFAVASVTPDPESFLRDRLGERDAELAARAIVALRELDSEAATDSPVV